MDCPVCNKPGLSEGISSCPQCDSKLSGFYALDALAAQTAAEVNVVVGTQRRWALPVIGLCALMLGGGFGYGIASDSDDITPANASKIVMVDDSNNQELQKKPAVIGSESVTGFKHVHVVRKGETLASIASTYYNDYLQYRKVADQNGIIDPYIIRPGDSLKITL